MRELSKDKQNEWVERLFGRLQAIYGSAFGRQWEGTNVADVKVVWADKLGGFTAAQIGAALKSCDDRQYPPNLPEFIDMCRQAARRVTSLPAIEAPQLSADELRDRSDKLASAVVQPGSYDFRGWCRELRRRYLAGEHLLPIQVSMASEAMNETWEKGECNSRVAA